MTDSPYDEMQSNLSKNIFTISITYQSVGQVLLLKYHIHLFTNAKKIKILNFLMGFSHKKYYEPWIHFLPCFNSNQRLQRLCIFQQ